MSLLSSDLVSMVLIATILLVGLSLLGLGIIMLRRVWQAAKSKVVQRNKALFINWIITCVHSKISGQSAKYRHCAKKLRTYGAGLFTRQLLIEVFQQYLSNLSGEYRHALIQLFSDLNLDKSVLLKIRSKNRHKNIQGISEVKDFNLRISPQDFKYLATSVHREVREELLSVLFDRDMTILPSLFATEERIPVWQRILIYDRMREMSPEQMPDLSGCLLTKNPINQVFLIDLIGRLKLGQYFIKMLNMLITEQPMVQVKIILTLITLKRSEAVPFLKKMTELTDDKRVLKAAWVAIRRLSKEKNGNDFNFLSIAS